MQRLTVSFLVAAAISISAITAQQALPRFEPGPCPFTPGEWARDVRLECGALVVAQDRARTGGPTLRLAVAVLHTKTPSAQPPLVLVHGGPSGPGGLRGADLINATRWSAHARDIVVYDQRGAGSSEPRLCPEVVALTAAESTRPGTPAEQRAKWMADARTCVASLKASGIDPDTFGSEINAADLIDLRHALGYPSWDVMGVSYGAVVAQETMRRDPHGVRSVILGSPELPAGLFQAEVPLSYQRVIERLVKACAAGRTCHEAFPTFESDFSAVYATLNATPQQVTLDRSNGALTIRLDGDRFLHALQGFPIGIARVPLLVHEFLRGDRARAARVLLGNGGQPGAGGNVLTTLVMCFDAYGRDYDRALAAVSEQVKPMFRGFLNDAQECPAWHTRFAANHAPVTSAIPTLLLTTEFDDRTPTDHARRIASTLSTSYVIELPGRTHSQLQGPCAEQIIWSFLENPSRPPPASCVPAMPGLTFELKDLEEPNLTFTIAAGDGRSTAFTGTWQAVFPAAPIPYRFELLAAGTQLTGVLNPDRQPMNVFDGKIEGATIAFKIKSPNGERTVSFDGVMAGDEIVFTRSVAVKTGGGPGGVGLFGSAAARTFVAKRVP